MNKRIGATLVALALGGGTVFATAPAFAEDAPPVEVVVELAEVVAPPVEPAPVVIESVVVTVPETVALEVVTEPVEKTGAVGPITTPAPKPLFKPVLWKGFYNLTPKFDQQFVIAWDATPKPTLQVFRDWVTVNGVCHSTYQGDLYADGPATDELIKSGVLTGAGEQWVGGSYKSEYSIVITTADCPPVVPPVDCTKGPVKSDPICAVDVIIVGPTGPTCTAAGNFDALTTLPPAQNPNGYEAGKYRFYLDRAYDGPGTYTLTLQKVGGYKINAPHFSGETFTVTVLPAIGFQSSDSAAPCFVEVPPPSDDTEWVVVTDFECDQIEVTETGVITTTTTELNPVTGDLSTSTTTADTSRTRLLNDDELATRPVCPPVVTEPPASDPPAAAPPVQQIVTPLAHTNGVEYQPGELEAVVFGTLLLVLVGGSLIVFGTIRARRNQ